MQSNVFYLIVAVLLLLLSFYLLQHYKKHWSEKLISFLRWIGAYALIFGVLYFLIIEWPKLEQEQERQNEQRRLYFFEILSKQDTPNRVREEAFVKLIEDYQITDFSGLPMSNLQESYKTPFSFIRCFRKFNTLIINQDTLVKIVYDSKLERYNKHIDLDKLNFWNSNLQYADFSEVTQKRMEYQQDWGVIDDEFGKFDYTFSFKYLTDTDLRYADLHGIIINDGRLLNVKLNDASLYNAELKKTVFEYCDLNSADFTGANLRDAAFYKTKINEDTKFIAVQNYKSIRIATPYIVEQIKATHFFDKNINNWDYEWTKIDSSANPEIVQKWHLWIELKNKYPNSYYQRYKKSIKDYYIRKYDENYDWEREL